MNVNDHSPVTELQVTVCVFGSTYVCIPSYSGRANLSAGVFVRLIVLPLQGFEVTHPIF